MKYLAIIHKDDNSSYGITMPDFPGCFASAENLEDIEKNVQEALELWADGEEFEPSTPLSMEDIAKLDEAKDGTLCLVDINFDFLENKTVPVNISMPIYMRKKIDRIAKSKGLTRSALLLKAVEALA